VDVGRPLGRRLHVAASLFFLGLTGWQVLISMLVGITAVYFLMNLIDARRCATAFRSGRCSHLIG